MNGPFSEGMNIRKAEIAMNSTDHLLRSILFIDFKVIFKDERFILRGRLKTRIYGCME